jgi:hypothetical protein
MGVGEMRGDARAHGSGSENGDTANWLHASSSSPSGSSAAGPKPDATIFYARIHGW